MKNQVGSSENTAEKKWKAAEKKSESGSQRSKSHEDRRENRRDDRGENVRRRQRNSSPNGSEEAAQNTGRTLWVNGLDPKIKEKHLDAVFGPLGEIDKIVVIREPFTQDSRGFGFVTYKTNEPIAEAIAKLNKTELKGKLISVELSHRGKARTNTPGKYLGNSKASSQYNRGGR